MYRRPNSVSIVGYLLTCFGFLAMLHEFFKFGTFEPGRWTHAYIIHEMRIEFGVSEVLAGITFLCGVFILKGANWARWLYTVISVAIPVADVILLRSHFGGIIFGIAFRFLLIVLLFLTNSNEYFTARNRDRR
jgi:hypothetical protein